MANYDGQFSGRDVTLRLEVYQDWQDVNANYSRISWTLRAFRNSNVTAWSNYTSYWHVNIDGQNWNGTWTYNFGSNANQVIATGYRDVYHNSDGTKAFGVSSDAQGEGYLGNAGNSGTFYATTIPRSSSMTFINPMDAGTNYGFAIQRASTSFTHTIDYYFGNTTGRVATSVPTSFSWTPPMSLLTQIPNSGSGTGTLRLHTYNGGTLIGYRDYSFTLTAPSSANPTFTGVTHSEATFGVAANVGAYVQGVSTLAVAINGATAQYGASIASYKIEVAGQVVNAASGTTGRLAQSGTVPLTATITDTRGRSSTQTVNVTIMAYTAPAITSAIARRALSDGTPAVDTGTYVRVDLNAAVQSLINGTQRNQLVYKISSRPRGTSLWTLQKTSALTAGTITFNSFTTVSGPPLEQAWDYLIEVSDDFNTTAVQVVIATAGVFMHWGDQGEGVGIGKFWERGALDTLGQMYQNDGKKVLDTATLVGSATARDAFWGVPTTSVARLALHLSGARWTRSDKGWVEQYFTVTGDGATKANGAVEVSGWYPVSGRLPYSRRFQGGGAVGMGTPTYNTQVGFMQYSSADTPEVATVSGQADDLILLIGGSWRLKFHITFSFSGTSHEAAFFLSTDNGTTYPGTIIKTFTTGATSAYTHLSNSTRQNFAANDRIRLRYASAGPVTGICYEDVFFNEVEYVGPPFITGLV
jgi:hypothetical protein